MSEITRVPISDILGDRNGTVRVEESWSKDVPSTVGAEAPVEMTEINREAIFKTVAGKSGRRLPQTIPSPVHGAQLDKRENLNHHFFVLKGRKLEFIGSKELDASKFAKDVSGRFYREWLKGAFPGRKDYEDIVSFDDNQTLKDMAELLEMAG